VKNVYYLQPAGQLIVRQSPTGVEQSVWGEDYSEMGFYGLSDDGTLFSYWYQDLGTRDLIIAVFYQEFGENSLAIAKYVDKGDSDPVPWEKTSHSIDIQNGSPIVAAPAGLGTEMILYIGGTDGKLKQLQYNLNSSSLGDPFSTSRPPSLTSGI
jgi:hypothetical protein